ncbi:putative protein phosphatase 2C 64 [Porphyridium purpureum]|uniref:PPM-type phosphatase domain-containing protein n=1 Tax=Porphyridium purpureum TaxID=35688 RepID=A0A5J4YV08_PORPP|nr:putative protein phosphatase 2C 64 [Porphyridium purpureum]|eukprot:POR2285..scf227_4
MWRGGGTKAAAAVAGGASAAEARQDSASRSGMNGTGDAHARSHTHTYSQSHSHSHAQGSSSHAHGRTDSADVGSTSSGSHLQEQPQSALLSQSVATRSRTDGSAGHATAMTSRSGTDDLENDKAETGSVDSDGDALDPNNGAMQRLSLDGDLLMQRTVRPNAAPDYRDGEDGEGRVELALDKVPHIKFGACTKAGWEQVRGENNRSVEVRKTNQDAYCAMGPWLDHQMLFGVFDGHGTEGRTVSHSVRDSIASGLQDSLSTTTFRTDVNSESVERRSMIHRVRMRALSVSHAQAEKVLHEVVSDKADHMFSGTTAICVWLHGNDCYTACVGDSRAILGRRATSATGKERCKPVGLSYDQKPTRPDEKKRVRAAGGRIARWRRNMGPLRVWMPREWIPGLAMTRSIGDTILSEYGVMPIPEVTHVTLTESDMFIVLASDGVWEFMTSREVCDFVTKMHAAGSDAAEAAEALVAEAVRRWRRMEVVVDDTTAIVLYLDIHSTGNLSKSGKKKGLFSAFTSSGEKPVLILPNGLQHPFAPKNDSLKD